MITASGWLWDRKIGEKKAKEILKDPDDEAFFGLASLLLARNNSPKYVFKNYLQPLIFFRNWEKIKRRMRKDSWNNPRIKYWQAIYETLKEKYKKRGTLPARRTIASKAKRDELCKSIGDKISAARKHNNLTQKQLAGKLKVSQQLISRIESGRENISLRTLKNIVTALGGRIYLDILQ